MTDSYDLNSFGSYADSDDEGHEVGWFAGRPSVFPFVHIPWIPQPVFEPVCCSKPFIGSRRDAFVFRSVVIWGVGARQKVKTVSFQHHRAHTTFLDMIQHVVPMSWVKISSGALRRSKPNSGTSHSFFAVRLFLTLDRGGHTCRAEPQSTNAASERRNT